jgi:hypothetical protein
MSAANYWVEATPRKVRFGRATHVRGTNTLRDDGRRPPGFTGRQGDGGWFYLGRPWTGPTNAVGHKGLL